MTTQTRKLVLSAVCDDDCFTTTTASVVVFVAVFDRFTLLFFSRRCNHPHFVIFLSPRPLESFAPFSAPAVSYCRRLFVVRGWIERRSRNYSFPPLLSLVLKRWSCHFVVDRFHETVRSLPVCDDDDDEFFSIRRFSVPSSP